MSRPAQPRFDVLLFPDAVVEGPRYLVAHLPGFRVERCGWSAHAIVGLVAERQGAVRLVALSPAAREVGLAVGMTASEARAREPGVVLEPLDEDAEAADRAELVRCLEPWCDRVATLGPDTLVLEVSGCAAWYGDEATLVARVRERLAELGHVAQLAVSDHPRASSALAACGIEAIVPVGQGAEALAGLPLAALEPSPELADAWATLGLGRVGQLARLDAASVAGRWGAEGVELHRVARGQVGPAWTVRPVEAPIERLRLPLDDELADVAAVAVHLQQGLVRLREVLAARDLVAAALEVRLELAWGTSVTLRVRVAHPSRDPVLLGRLVRDRLERLTLHAPVSGLLLHATEVAPDGAGQGHLLERREGGGRWSELVARLLDVLGDQAVGFLRTVPCWRPEAACRTVPVQVASAPVAAEAPVDDPVEVQEGAAWRARRPRPTRLRGLPLPVRVEARQGRPVALGTRRGWLPIRRASGPEHLSGGWWESGGGFDRSYWVVGLPQGTAWVFEAQGQWFVHGWFD